MQNAMHRVDSILKRAEDADMATGFVTTTRVVHATPLALYAHTANRRRECETKMKTISKERGCKDIARQSIEDEPGRNINVIMGGGRQCLVSNVTTSPNDPVHTWSCYSTEGRDLINDWHIEKEQRQLRHAILRNNNDLTNLNANNNDFVLGKSVVSFTFSIFGLTTAFTRRLFFVGIFTNGHLKELV